MLRFSLTLDTIDVLGSIYQYSNNLSFKNTKSRKYIGIRIKYICNVTALLQYLGAALQILHIAFQENYKGLLGVWYENSHLLDRTSIFKHQRATAVFFELTENFNNNSMKSHTPFFYSVYME